MGEWDKRERDLFEGDLINNQEYFCDDIWWRIKVLVMGKKRRKSLKVEAYAITFSSL